MGGFGEFFYFVGIVDYAIFMGPLEIIVIQLGGYGYCLHSFIMPFTGHSEQCVGHVKHNRI